LSRQMGRVMPICGVTKMGDAFTSASMPETEIRHARL
jgi:hypothetical protein